MPVLGLASLLRSMRYKRSGWMFAIEGIEGCSEQDSAGTGGLRMPGSGMSGSLDF